jgi:hypothetical protein
MTRPKINDGLSTYQRYYRKHKAERKQKSHDRHILNKEKNNARCIEYNETHHEERLEYDRKYYQEHREEKIAKTREWNKEHPEQFAANQRKSYLNTKDKRLELEAQRRRSWSSATIGSHRRRSITVSITTDELSEFAQTIDYCQYCGQRLEWDRRVKGGKKNMKTSPSLDRVDNDSFIDHIWQGDSNTTGAAAIICSRCNVSKQDRSLSEYLIYCSNILSSLSYIL